MFRRNAQIEQVLFAYPNFSVKQIRRLGGEKHDHVFLWQFYSEAWLQHKEISLNSGIPPSRHPTEENKQKRKGKLIRWEKEIKKLEREAREYEDD